ncbi:Transcriptional regulator, LysR family (plasmid) [Paraburkholderia phenoliruptrix BR3459a]|nr:Transcriptional regulator, LysR family [Paraburkholderia phenoliruptrix BR3459a]
MALLNAILDDLGYGLVPAMQAGPLIASGRLVALAPGQDLMIDQHWPHLEEPEPLAMVSPLVSEAARQPVQPSPMAEGATRLVLAMRSVRFVILAVSDRRVRVGGRQ